mmetsp:Transcript_10174/g.23529  ORF Transcript_10174/g.23529 Transcript_10174/m.23529 type:complete len:231 (-) Transcript_10174:1736-2428(-)
MRLAARASSARSVSASTARLLADSPASHADAAAASRSFRSLSGEAQLEERLAAPRSSPSASFVARSNLCCSLNPFSSSVLCSARALASFASWSLAAFSSAPSSARPDVRTSASSFACRAASSGSLRKAPSPTASREAFAAALEVSWARRSCSSSCSRPTSTAWEVLRSSSARASAIIASAPLSSAWVRARACFASFLPASASRTKVSSASTRPSPRAPFSGGCSPNSVLP